MPWPAEAAVLPDVFTESGGYATGAHFNDTRALVRAICAELGLNPKGQAADVAARLAAIEAGSGGVSQEAFDALVARVSALEGGAGELPAGDLTAKVVLYHSSTVALPTTGDWFGIDFNMEPVKVWPYGVRKLTDLDGRVVDAWEASMWKMPLPYTPRWVRVRAGLALPKAIADWGTIGVALFDVSWACNALVTMPFTDATKLKVDGSLWVEGVDAPSAHKWWYIECEASYYLAEPRSKYGLARFLHTVGQGNINGAEAPLDPVACGRGTFVEVSELTEA